MDDDELIRRGDVKAAAPHCFTCDWHEAIAALPAVTVGVKPLVWEDFDGRGAKASAFYQANYLIQFWRGQEQFEVALSYPGYQTGYDGPRWHDTLEAAKAAAQADYRARILAALEPQPASDAAAMEPQPAPAEDAKAKGETDGETLERLGMDGAKWAAEFRTTALRLGYSDMNEGWLIGWFANAIMAGYDRKPVPDAAAIRIADEVFDRLEAKGATTAAFGAAEVGEALREAGAQSDAAAIREAALREAINTCKIMQTKATTNAAWLHACEIEEALAALITEKPHDRA